MNNPYPEFPSRYSQSTFNFGPLPEFNETKPTITIPPMAAGLRRSGRHRTASDSGGPSGSEYHGSEKSMEAPPTNDGMEEDEPPIVYGTSQRGRRIQKKKYTESNSEDDGIPAEDLFLNDPPPKSNSRHSHDADDDDEDGQGIRRYPRRTRSRQLADFIVSDEEDKVNGNGRYPTRNRTRKQQSQQSAPNGAASKPRPNGPSQRARRFARRTAARDSHEEDYVANTSSGASADADGSIDDAPRTSSDLEPEPEPEPEPEEEGDGKPYALRQRQKINYAIPPPLEEMAKPPPKPAGGRNGRNGFHGGHRAPKGRSLGWSANGAELGRWMGMGGDDSDSDHPTRTPRKPFGAVGGFGAGGVAGAGAGAMLPGDLAAGGTPSNLGKIGDSALADADPLGVNVNVTFDEVGGLDDHIHSLKEMTLLPLLYPEVFQRFNVTPPRGVLFHGPPGTGKTLLARALAASCRSNGKSISFFMRKGADCLSKWVGEAERQLRLLFEEARSCQPSIIFFDEIDGLAPVRSSKQDQIHASIVSTLLALMDGMDGRGQVIVIGATNRPDAIDPALRRPGRFDREFYFGLPGLEAREKILGIMTKGWEGWGESEGPAGKERLNGLAKLTKGYGGADLRALCTEAALNAVQRRYPQIYQSNDRLLLKPETIGVGLRDFMISIKKLVPSSARSSSSVATPLPTQFTPLLAETLEQVKTVIGRVMPIEKKLTALEEAQFEDDDGEEGALEREMLMQSMQTLRVYRPRVILHGQVGMGQTYVGAAALHHLEGYHVQSLELGTLMSDSTRTAEAAIVQLFVEAKRHQPSVVYIPSLIGWCAAVSETSRSTVRAMLDTLAPTDPILLLAIVDGNFSELPHDVKAWFGPSKDNRVELLSPSADRRAAFFEQLIKDIRRPPNQFADGVKRKKRILEELPIAPPLEPRQPTAAELAVQEENDQKVITLLKYRLGPILTELKRKFKRFTKRATEEYNFEEEAQTLNALVEPAPIPVEQPVVDVNGVIEITEGEQVVEQPAVNGLPNGIVHLQQAVLQLPPLYDMDLERMHTELYRGRYLTPQDFLDDVGKMVHNADVRSHEDLDRLYKAQAMYTATQVSIQEFDPQFRLECDRMAVRERKRREEHKKAKAKSQDEGDQAQNGQPLVARRSARNNGQQPELGITDPVQLERRLKRQRSNEAASDAHVSEEENGENRDAKRVKMVVDGPDNDPLDIVGALTPLRPTIRFAPLVEPIQSLDPPSLLNDVDTHMVADVDPPPRRGFNEDLLNPLPPAANYSDITPNMPSPLPTMNGIIHSQPAMPIIDPSSPFFSNPIVAPVPTKQSSSYTPILPSTPKPLSPEADKENEQEKEKEKEKEKSPPPVPMIIERTPTPLPDFHLDEGLVADLQRKLRDDTAALTVEELEQLRATCLGAVWRHRSDWDRDELVRELQTVVQDFVSEFINSSMSP